MEGRDLELVRRVRDVLAVLVEDIDAVMWEVEDGVAYIEGVVPTEQDRNRISRAVGQIDGISHVITCLCTERIFKSALDEMQVSKSATPDDLLPFPVSMFHYYLS